MRRLLVFAETNVRPPKGKVDLSGYIHSGYCRAGPLLASVSYWIHRANVPATPEEPGGGFDVTLQWHDPVGTSRSLGGQSLSLNDAAGEYTSPTQQINRRGETTLLQLVFGSSNPGKSRISYSVVLMPSVATDLIWCFT